MLTNDIKGPRKIPEGTYDIGDGYYDPVKRVMCEYDSNFKRDLNEGEDEWRRADFGPQDLNEPADWIQIARAQGGGGGQGAQGNPQSIERQTG